MALDLHHLVEQLLPHVMKFIGRSDGGRWRFQLLCSVPKCRRMDTISASDRTIENEREHRPVCEKFVRGGWRFQDGLRCPDCGRAGVN